MGEKEEKLAELVEACRALVKKKTASKGKFGYITTKNYLGQDVAHYRRGSWTMKEMELAHALAAYEASCASDN